MKTTQSNRRVSACQRFCRGMATIIALGGLQVVDSSEAFAQANTLFRWNYGNGGDTKDAAEKLAEPLVTDRPDFTEASSTVGLGVVQLEAGYTYTYDANNRRYSVNHSYPETLLRVGILAEWFEARVGWNYGETGETTLGGSRFAGAGSDPLYLGVKLALTGQEGLLPEMGLMPQLTIPTGDDEEFGDESLPGLGWLYGWDVNDWLSFGGETQANRALEAHTKRAYLEVAQSLTVGYELHERVGAYTEWYVIAPDGAERVHTQNYFNFGTTFLVNDNLQLDIRYGVGLNEAADDYFSGAGFAWRL